MNKWTEDELAAAVEAYRQMEARLANGSALEKTRVYRELVARHGRTSKAWEYRMQNISHVLDQADKPWLPGLLPASKVGARVEPKLAKLLGLSGETLTSVSGPTRGLLEQEVKAAEASGSFSPANEADERQRVLAAIVRRRGQPAFRKALLDAYGGRCAMTGCNIVDALEAAHIRPYSGRTSNVACNGLLLRADVHTLFDIYLISVNPKTLRICLSPALQDSPYSEINDKPLAIPTKGNQKADQSSLAWHASQCLWM
ncbi:HNH endonuclease [Stenotrophomonas maltophilia]|uniref:HNH endonuclease n=1 Tax=Stenotrophomonas maltophilia TaxID=40324 RepID=UPI0039173450